MKKKRIEFEKSELIFLLNILENLADELYEDDLIDEEEKQKKIELINSIYLKVNERLGEVLPKDLRKYLFYEHQDYTNSYIIEAVEDLNKKGKI